MKIKSVEEISNKIVLLRVDYNVPLDNDKIKDNFKIKNSLSTIKLLLKNNCKIVIATHLGRPKGKVVEELRTNLIAKELEQLLELKVVKLDDCIGDNIKRKIARTKAKVVMLENVRFYQEEQENDYAFAHSLAELAEVYVNDAFAVSHRKHASISAITKFIPSYAGLSLKNEIFQFN